MGTVKIFTSMIPKVKTTHILDDADALTIWNAIKQYDSPLAFIEANSGAFAPQDIRTVYREGNVILRQFILPFIGGSMLKEEATFDEEGVELTPRVLWNPDTDKVEFRDHWRATEGDNFHLDIVRVYLDWDDSAFN